MKKNHFIFKSLIAALFLLGIYMCCSSCSLVHNHTNKVRSIVKPTCTEFGYTIYVCTECGETWKKEGFPPLGHNGEITRKGYEASCTSEGLSDEITCSVCGEIIQEQKAIKELGHNGVITQVGKEATCTEDGITDVVVCSVCGEIIKKAEIIPALGHSDINSDDFCDRCGELCRKAVLIYDVDGLKRINENLEGKYQLAANISLAGIDWTPIGTANHQFSGHLQGNGYAISGLSFSDKEECGLFLYNSGTITDVVIKDVNYSISNKSGAFGALVTYNYGTINNCCVYGKVTDNVSIQTNHYSAYDWGNILNSYPEKYVTYSSVIGGICAKNEGIIKNCTISGAFSNTFSNTTSLHVEPAWPYFGSVVASSTLHVYFGCIAGINNKTIENCQIDTSSNSVAQLSSSVNKVTQFPVTYEPGLAKSNTNAFIGNIVGENNGNIRLCTSKKATIVSEKGETATSKSPPVGVECNLNLYHDNMYNGLLGKNNGSVDSVFGE